MGVNNEYLKISNVDKYFEKDGETFQVLNNINLTVAEGEFLCIVGASGCGKKYITSFNSRI